MPITSSSKAGPAVELLGQPHKHPSPNVYVQVPALQSVAFVVPPSAIMVRLGKHDLQIEVVQLSGLVQDLLWEMADLHSTVDSHGQSVEALHQQVTTSLLESPPPMPTPSPPALPCVHRIAVTLTDWQCG
ncbi:hypothetical protein JVU11DRAFT_10604 [Chiua virens]|nr:hypothetical protein JVU11DRAFT_10604 [Chiua virens]